tara:strand:+ start:503 stop:1675 length:1173 start_codon:yes stop_codon:yes gene_type:complete
MSDSLLTILEIIQESLSEQEQKKVGVLDKDQSPEVDSPVDKQFLEVDRIVNAILARKERTAAGRVQEISLEDSLETVKGFNTSLIQQVSSSPSCKSINEALISYFDFKPKETSCRDISSTMSGLLANAAYNTILERFDASSAGFENEKLVAYLLDGAQVETNTKIDDTSYDDIADLSIAGGRVGISLKTKKKGVSGSYLNLLATLGVKFKVVKGKKVSKVFTPKQDKYPGGLFYVFYGKPQAKTSLNFFSITTAHVTKESAMRMTRDATVDEDGYLMLKSYEIDKPDFLRTSYHYTKFADQGFKGFADVQSVQFSPEETIKLVKNDADFLEDKLVQTLNMLNVYFGSIEDAIMNYSINPTPQKLQAFATVMKNLSKLRIQEITTCVDQEL